MATRDFVVGDTAKLISGGPDMTVVKVIPKSAGTTTSVPIIPPIEASVDCWWFDHNSETDCSMLCKASFPPDALMLISEKPVSKPTPAPTP